MKPLRRIGRDLARVEEVLDHPLAVAPAPPARRRGGAPAVDVEVADGDRAPLARSRPGPPPPARGCSRATAPHAAPGVLAGHAPAQQRMALDRVQRRLVAPVLEHLAAAPQPPAQGVAVVGPEPGEEHQLVAAGDHVDRVELHRGQPVEHPPEVAASTRPVGPRLGEALGGQRHPPGVAPAHLDGCGHRRARYREAAGVGLRLFGSEWKPGAAAAHRLHRGQPERFRVRRGADGLPRGGRLRPV